MTDERGNSKGLLFLVMNSISEKMSFLELVKKRRSVRKYASQPVAREAILRCLEAARLAPSACNAQPWNFVVVNDPALKDKLAEAAFSGMYAVNSFIKTAPVFVVVVREASAPLARFGGFATMGIWKSLIFRH